MGDEPKERWFELCELASKEQDPKELLALVREVNRLLEEKEVRLHPKREIAIRQGNPLPETTSLELRCQANQVRKEIPHGTFTQFSA